MATLDRRVQILFDPAVYAALEAEALAQRQSVAAIIREAVDDRIRMRRATKREALARLFESGDRNPGPFSLDWEEVKDSFERESLRDLP